MGWMDKTGEYDLKVSMYQVYQCPAHANRKMAGMAVRSFRIRLIQTIIRDRMKQVLGSGKSVKVPVSLPTPCWLTQGQRTCQGQKHRTEITVEAEQPVSVDQKAPKIRRMLPRALVWLEWEGGKKRYVPRKFRNLHSVYARG